MPIIGGIGQLAGQGMQQGNEFSALLGGYGSYSGSPLGSAMMQQQQQSNYLNRKIWESPPLSFLQSLRNEIDEWLKL